MYVLCSSYCDHVMLKCSSFSDHKVIVAVLLVNMWSFCVFLIRVTTPYLLRWNFDSAVLYVDLKLMYRTFRVPGWTTPMRALNVCTTIVVEKQTGVSTVEVEKDWIAPCGSPGICSGDIEVGIDQALVAGSDVCTHNVELAVVISNSWGNKAKCSIQGALSTNRELLYDGILETQLVRTVDRVSCYQSVIVWEVLWHGMYQCGSSSVDRVRHTLEGQETHGTKS